MKRSQLKQIIKETILEDKGYSNFIPGKETSGLDKKTLDSILLRIAKGDKPSDEEHSVARGNRILDKADPENVARITRGEKPIYENEIERMQELAGLQQEIKVNNPTKIQLYNLKTNQNYYGEKETKSVWFYLRLNDELFPESANSKKFLDKRNIPYELHSQYISIPNASKYFEFNKK